MQTQSALIQLSAKKRYYSDLSRFLTTRTSDVPNFTLLLGAGCSISSGIRSASELTALWKKEIYGAAHPEEDDAPLPKINEYLAREHASWYVANREYSCLFEHRFDLPRQRRMFIEAEVSEKQPNIGYAYLIRLIEAGYFNTIFTTNFDDLVNEAFFQFSDMRPIVRAHDSSVSSITVSSKRAKIIKLHGDYLFDDIKSTVRETESLEENTKKKFIEFSRDHGLIVAGYSGSDRSIMDVLNHLLRSDDYFRHGIYWCIRKGDTPSEELQKLLWRDRVYFVEIDGFDDLMAQLHDDALGPVLPVETSLISDKPQQIIRSFCESPHLIKSQSEVIKRDIDRLKKIFDRERLLDAIRDVSRKESDEERSIRGRMNDAEVGCVISAKQLIASGDYDSARSILKDSVSKASSWQAQEEFLVLAVKNEESCGNRLEALNRIEDLIKLDPRQSAWLLWKASLLKNNAEKLAAVESALSIDPFSCDALNDKARALISQFESGLGLDSSARAILDEALEKSLDIDPSLGNEAWVIYSDFLIDDDTDASRKKLRELVERAELRAPRNAVLLRAKMKCLKAEGDPSKNSIDTFLEQVKNAKESCSRHLTHDYEWLLLDAYDLFERETELTERINDLAISEAFQQQPGYLFRRGNHLLKRHGDLHAAIDDVALAVRLGKKSRHILRLANLLQYAGDQARLNSLSEDYSKYLSVEGRNVLQKHVAEAAGDYKKCVALSRASNAGLPQGISSVVYESHALLQMGSYGEAEALCKGLLDRTNFNPMHGALIINFELSRSRQGMKPNGGRLGKIVELSKDKNAISCALYLLNDTTTAAKKFSELLEQNKENMYVFSSWAIFQDSRGRDFLTACAPEKQRGVLSSVAA